MHCAVRSGLVWKRFISAQRPFWDRATLAGLAAPPAAAFAGDAAQASLGGQLVTAQLAPSFCLGIVTALMLYGLLKSLVLRDRAQLEYALCALGLAIGLAAPLLAPAAGDWTGALSVAGFAFAGICATALANRLFGTGRPARPGGRALRLASGLFAAGLGAALVLPAGTLAVVATGVYLAALVFAVFAAAILFHRRDHDVMATMLGLLASVSMLVGLAVHGVGSFGGLGAGTASGALGAGSAGMLLLLAAALTRRAHAELHEQVRTQSEALAGSEQLIQTLQASEALLTQAVARRGAELDAVTRRLQDTEQQHLYATHHDPLTGLANQLLLMDRITHGIARSKRHNCRVAVVVVDLDDFGALNDAYGARVGDRILKSVATRLCGIVRGQDTVARIGSDEFAIVLEEVFDPLDVQRVANAVTTEVAQSFDTGGEIVTTSASIGCAIFPDGGADATALLRHADKLMRRSKRGKAFNCSAGNATSTAA